MARKIHIERVAHLTGHRGSIYALAPAPEPHCFFSGDGNGWIAKWDLHNTEVAKVIAQVPSNIFSLCLIPSKNLLAVGSMQGVLYFIDLAKNEVIAPTLQFPKAVFDLKIWGEYLYVAVGDGVLSAIPLHNLTTAKPLKISDKAIRSMSFHPTQPLVIVGSSDHLLHLIDLEQWKVVQTLPFHKNSVFAAVFSASGQQIVSGSRDAHLTAWQLENDRYQIAHTVPAHLFTVNALAFSPAHQFLASGSRDKTIKIWQPDSLQLLKVIDNFKPEMATHTHSVNALLWLPYQNLLISGSDDRSLIVWKICRELGG